MKVHVLDTYHLGRPRVIAVTALESEHGLILFDTGPESTFDTVVSELRKIGFNLDDVRHVFLSHIHFDHAGAAWRFAECGARIYVHPRGAPHLVDPAKLLASATRIYGNEMERLLGRFAPVSAERLTILSDGDAVEISPFRVRVMETPGHANHHYVYYWNDTLFGGDVAGVRIGGGPPVPPLVPPELHVESWLESIEKIRALNVSKLFLPHFGQVEGSITEHFDLLADRIRRWSIWFRDQIREGQNDQQLAAAFAEKVTSELREAHMTEEEAMNYESADPSFMAVSAEIRYWSKYHPEDVGRV
jgi:glyoxylase-like metal-dependent hydrolase (beta-lactamase superfamily II)